MRKLILIVFTFLIGIINVFAVEINSKNAIMYNLNDNSIIYEKDSYTRVSIASLTKIVTAITVIENVEDLSKEVVITWEMLEGLDGYVKAGFQVGDKLTYMDLLYELMLPSAADAAQALAISTSGSIENFSNLMNEKIKEIGVTNTLFDNPVGKDSENNYSTAYDLSKILIYCLKNETFKTLFTSNYYRIDSLDKELEKTLINTGKLYNLDLSMIDGAKTGFTYDAGRCLASIAKLDGVNYLVVVLGADVNTIAYIIDTVNLYEYFSTNYGYINVLSVGDLLGTIKVKDSKTKAYNIYSKDNVDLYLEKSTTKDNLEYLYNGVEELNKNIKYKDKLGDITILKDGEEIYRYEVYLEEKIKYYNYPLYIGIGITLIVLIAFILILVFKKKRK